VLNQPINQGCRNLDTDVKLAASPGPKCRRLISAALNLAILQ
jgi:hypothetical protein